MSFMTLKRFEEAKSLLRKTMPVARRVLGESHDLTLRMRWSYAAALYEDNGATLDDLREAVTTLEDTARTARRVLGSAHPVTKEIEKSLQNARAALSARETPPPRPSAAPMTTLSMPQLREKYASEARAAAARAHAPPVEEPPTSA